MDVIIGYLQKSLFYELATLLLLAGILGFIGQKLRQPLIVVFIAVGLLAGPDMLGLVPEGEDSHSSIDTLAKLGIALLLFMVGLKLNPSVIKSMGVMALIAGTAQVTITTVLGTGIFMALGFGIQASFICGLCLSFSSTIIVVKLLSDQREIESLYGKMALGILIIQDLAVIITLVVLSGLAESVAGGGEFTLTDLGLIGLKLVGILMAVFVFTRLFSNHLAHALAQSSELTVIFAIGFASAMAALCDSLGLSKELGGLLAGVTLAPTAFRTAIYARLASLRDFLLLFFFISLGAQLSFDNVGMQIGTALMISAFVLIGKPIIVMWIMGLLGYRKRTYFQSGAVLSQISEFSMILAAVALGGGFITPDLFNIMTLTGMITIALSTYFALNSVVIYRLVENIIGVFERESFQEEDFTEKIEREYDVIIFGMGRYGSAMAKRFQIEGARILGVDFDPDTVRYSQKEGIPTIYGDASDPEFPAFLPLGTAHTAVLCIPPSAGGPMVIDSRRALTKSLRNMGFTGRIALTSHRREREGEESDDELHELSVDVILHPYKDAAEAGAEQLLNLHKKQCDEGTLNKNPL